MDVDEVVQYWVELAVADWPVVNHLFASGDYNYSLFLGHLYLEKLLKALVVKVTRQHAPRTHNLLLLAERSGLTISKGKRDILLRVNGYSIETRYPEQYISGQKQYTREHCESEIDVIRKVAQWLKSELKRERK